MIFFLFDLFIKDKFFLSGLASMFPRIAFMSTDLAIAISII